MLQLRKQESKWELELVRELELELVRELELELELVPGLEQRRERQM